MDFPQTPKHKGRVVLLHANVSSMLPSPERVSPQPSKQEHKQYIKEHIDLDTTTCPLLTPLQSQPEILSTPDSPVRITSRKRRTSQNASRRIITPPSQITSSTLTQSELDITPVQRHPMTLITVEELQKIKRVKLSNPFLEDPFPYNSCYNDNINDNLFQTTSTTMEFVNGTTGKKSIVHLSQRQLEIKPKRLDFSQVQYSLDF